MDLKLKGRTALITGASRGIGRGVARLLAEEGCHLHLAARNAADLEDARRELTAQYGVNVHTHALDLAKAENMTKLVAQTGPVDILVNNAGAIPHAAITEFTDQSWRDGWDLKVFGFINITREVYREMCAAKRGVIINVAGVAGERPLANYIAGSMGNAALMTMSRALGADSVRHGVRVVAVNPGGIETERQEASWRQRARELYGDENRWRELGEKRPIKRFGTVEEVANMIVFLCSERCSYVSGTVITVDGGTSAA